MCARQRRQAAGEIRTEGEVHAVAAALLLRAAREIGGQLQQARRILQLLPPVSEIIVADLLTLPGGVVCVAQSQGRRLRLSRVPTSPL